MSQAKTEANAPRVLVVDDEPQIRRLLALALRGAGYSVETVASGEECLDQLAVAPFDVLLLDLGLPDLDGTEVCRRVREWSSIPIIVVSVRDDESDKVLALDAGADDYLTKPFGIDELLARMRASLRRLPGPLEAPVLELGAVTIDLGRRMVWRSGTQVHLTPTEYDLLRTLAAHAGRVVTHRQLLRATRGPAYEADTPLLRVHIAALRQKLAVPPDTPGYISTEPGIGYRLLDQ